MAVKTLAWLLVPLLGLAELAGHAYFSRRAPRPEEWDRVEAAVAALRKNGELVVVAPRWAEPNARRAFGDALMPIEQVARADVTAFPRAVEVSILGEHADELAGWREVSSRREGGFLLRVLDNPTPAKVTFDFVEALPVASVSDVSNGRSEPCHWDSNARRSAGGLHGNPAFPPERHLCSGPEFHFVGVTVVEDQEWKPRRCIWAHPVDKKTLALRYTDVPLGKTIRGYGALPWWIEREKKGAPVDLRIAIDDTVIGHYRHEDGHGFRLFEFDTGAFAGRRADVELRVSTTRARDRQFCFVLDSR